MNLYSRIFGIEALYSPILRANTAPAYNYLYAFALTDTIYASTELRSAKDLVNLGFAYKFMAERIFNNSRHKKQIIEGLKINLLPRLKSCTEFYRHFSMREFRKLKYILENLLDHEYFFDNRVEILKIFCETKNNESHDGNKHFADLLRDIFDRGLLLPQDIVEYPQNSLTLACEVNNIEVFKVLADVLGHSDFMDCLYKNDYYKTLLRIACRNNSSEVLEFLVGFQLGKHSFSPSGIKRGFKYYVDEVASRTPISEVIYPHARGLAIITLLSCFVPLFSNYSPGNPYFLLGAYSSYFALNGYLAYKKHVDDHPSPTQYITYEDIRFFLPELLRIVCENGRFHMLIVFMWMGLTLEDLRQVDNLALRIACTYGHVNIVRILREFGLSHIDFMRADGGELLTKACMANDREKIVSEILFAIPSELRLDYIRAEDNRALKAACRQGNIKCVEKLKMFGITVDDFRANDNEIIKSSCVGRYRNPQMFDFVLKHLSAEDVCDGLLFLACGYGYYDSVRKIAEKICKQDISIPQHRRPGMYYSGVWHEASEPQAGNLSPSPDFIRAITANKNKILKFGLLCNKDEVAKIFIEYGLKAEHLRAYDYKVIRALNNSQDVKVRIREKIKDLFRRKLRMSEDELQKK